MTWLHQTQVREPIPAGATPVLTGALVTEDGGRVPGAELDSLVLTLTDRASGAIVNGRDHQDILGVNGGSVSPAGAFRLELTAADTTLLVAARREGRRALVEWSYAGGLRCGMHEVVFAVAQF